MSARSLALSTTLLLVALSACKSDPPAEDARPDLEPKAKAANDEVPEPLKAELGFEVQELDDGNILALVPKGWTPGFMPGRFEPATTTFGERLSYTIGSNCDGVCTKKEWPPIIDKLEFGSSVPAGLAVELDEALGETGRLKVFAGSDELFIRAAWWLPQSNRYFYCKADLEGQAVTAKQAFISACKATHVLDWD